MNRRATLLIRVREKKIQLRDEIKKKKHSWLIGQCF